MLNRVFGYFELVDPECLLTPFIFRSFISPLLLLPVTGFLGFNKGGSKSESGATEEPPRATKEPTQEGATEEHTLLNSFMSSLEPPQSADALYINAVLFRFKGGTVPNLLPNLLHLEVHPLHFCPSSEGVFGRDSEESSEGGRLGSLFSSSCPSSCQASCQQAFHCPLSHASLRTPRSVTLYSFARKGLTVRLLSSPCLWYL